MSKRACCVGIAWIVMLTAASVCLAADPPGNRPGRGSIGGSMFPADADYSEGASPRFWFSAHFRYVFTPSWRAQVTPGFTWAGYGDEPLPFSDINFPADKNKSKVLTLVLPAEVQLQYTRLRGNWLYHLGGGGGLYRVWIENRRKVLKDPASLKLHRGVYPGVSAELGVAHFLKEHANIAIEAAVGGDWIFALREKQFPSGFDSFLLVSHVRVGTSYYFDLNRPAQKPGLPLGKAGK